MSRRNRIIFSISIPVLLLVIVGGLYLYQQRTPASTTQATPVADCHGTLTPLKLALDWTPNTNHTGIYVAKEKGWYAAQCIGLTILPYSQNVSSDVLVSSGQATVGISSTSGVVSDAAVKQPVVSIAGVVQRNTSVLVTLASSGLTNPRELDNKIYGGFGAPYESAVVATIIRNAGGKGVFKNVTLDIDTMQALETKRIDFAWVYQGWEVIQAERAGFKLNVFPVTSYGIPDHYDPTVITSPQEIKQQPDLLRRFMLATTQGYDYARTHAHDAAQLLINGAGASNFPDQGLVFASQDFLSAHYADPGRKWGLQDAVDWEDYPNFMLVQHTVLDENNQPVKSMDFHTLYTNQFIE